MLPCSVHEASAGAVSVWRVVRLQCSVRVVSAAGVECDDVKEMQSQFQGLRNAEWLAFFFAIYLFGSKGVSFSGFFDLADS